GTRGRNPDVVDLDVRVLLLEVGDDLLPDVGPDTAVVVPEGDLALAGALVALVPGAAAAVVAAGGGGQREHGAQGDGDGRAPASADVALHWSALFFWIQRRYGVVGGCCRKLLNGGR